MQSGVPMKTAAATNSRNPLLGSAWLCEAFALPQTAVRVVSLLGGRRARHDIEDGNSRQIFPASYAVDADPLAHLVFALKYESTDLLLLHAVFARLGAKKVAAFVRREPTGVYARKIGFLYEFLTGAELPLAGAEIGGNYVPILDPAEFITAAPRNIPRWRVRDNLPGTAAWCPTIRLTPTLRAKLGIDWRDVARAVLADAPGAFLERALGYLYAKETRSSFLIERETPGAEKQARFISALRDAGAVVSAREALAGKRLVALQNQIVEARYREAAFRTTQNYVGETLPDFSERVHYVCPPPEAVEALWHGLVAGAERLEDVPPVVQAAAVAFQFVFLHPFLDGNGRIHRFLLQDTLARRHLLPQGWLVPLSAEMLANPAAYDAALEAFSKPLLAQADYAIAHDRSLTLHNGGMLLPLWRFPDLTPQVEYLHGALERAIAAIPAEVAVLRHHDAARKAIGEIAAMPARKLDLLLVLLRENSGKIPKRKRRLFAELSDDELVQIETAWAAPSSDVSSSANKDTRGTFYPEEH
jgi:hypothetical protein